MDNILKSVICSNFGSLHYSIRLSVLCMYTWAYMYVYMYLYVYTYYKPFKILQIGQS